MFFYIPIISLTCYDFGSILLVAESCSAERMTKMTTTTEKKSALYFITEQACCLAQAQGTAGEDFLTCQKAAEFLADDDTDAIMAFYERTSEVKRDLTGLEDYDTEEYEGKRNDVRAAVIELTKLSTSEDIPSDKREALMKVADLIAGFYGMDGTLEARPV
jgi:hypothetical protein